ncbi:MAG: cobalamin-dependent protein [Acidobacteriota bacterium]
MSQPTAFASQILESSASAYAGFAASRLLELHPEISDRYAPTAMRDWKSHLTQRVLELSAALGVEEPQLFSSRIRWTGQALSARKAGEQDVRHSLQCLREVLREELPQGAQAVAAGYLDSALERLEASSHPAAGLDPNRPHERLALEYLQSVLEGDSPQAIATIVDAVAGDLSLRDAYLEVLSAAQREVGRMWHLGDLAIAEEHLVTSTTERVMSILAHQAERAPINGKTILAAAVADNGHDLGVRTLADFFEIAGWRSICLGANVPVPDIAKAVSFFAPDLLVLSAALSTQLKSLRQNIETVRKIEDPAVKVLVGGVVFTEAPDLWRQLGADGHAARADEAVELGARLIGL